MKLANWMEWTKWKKWKMLIKEDKMNKFNGMGIGKKIAMGFIVVLLIALISATFTLFNVININNEVGLLSDEYIEEVKQMNVVLEHYLEMNVYSTSYYQLGKEEDYIAAQEHLDIIDDALVEFEQLVDGSTALVEISDKVDTIILDIENFETLLDDTKELYDLEHQYHNEMNTALELLDSNVEAYFLDQEGKLFNEIESKKSHESIGKRYEKLMIISELDNDVEIINKLNTNARVTGDTTVVEEFKLMFPELLEDIAMMTERSSQANNLEQLANMKLGVEGFLEASIKYYQAIDDVVAAGTSMVEVGEHLLVELDEVNNNGIGNTVDIANQTQTTLGTTQMVTIVSTIAMIMLGIAISVVIVKNISKDLTSISDRLSKVTKYVGTASSELTGSSQQLSSGSTEQAAAIEQISSTMEETSSMILQTTENTRQAAGLTRHASESSESGVANMILMQESMEDIQKSSGEISKVIKVIDEIAFQTNILALNAAVEAARAGDAGKGFAVVAEEVRNLAHRSAEAAKDTAVMIENNIKLSKSGTQITKEVNDSLVEINTQTENINKLVEEVAAASEEQASGIKQITDAVNQMEDVVQDNAGTAEESAASAELLNNQAIDLNVVVAQLMTVIEGSRHSDSNKLEKVIKKEKVHANSHPKEHKPHINYKKTVKVNSKKVEDLIPLEEGEF